jgi:hypothetical protein
MKLKPTPRGDAEQRLNWQRLAEHVRGQPQYRGAVVITSNNTATVAESFTTPEDSIYRFTVRGVCRRTDTGTENGYFERRWRAYNAAGTVTLTSVGTDVTNRVTLTTADITAVVNGEAVEIKVTGETGKTIKWVVSIEFDVAR